LELTDFAVAWRTSSDAEKFNARRDQTIASAGFTRTPAAQSMPLSRDDRVLLMTGEARTVIAACAGDEGLTAELRFALKGIFDKAVDKAGAAGHVTSNPKKKRKNAAAAAAAEGEEASAAHVANLPVPPAKAGRKRKRRLTNNGETPKPKTVSKPPKVARKPKAAK